MADTDRDNNESRGGFPPNKRSKVQEVVDLTVDEDEEEEDQVLLVSNAQLYDDDEEVEVVDAPLSESLILEETEAAAEQAAAAAHNDDDQDVQLVGRRHVQALPHMRPHCTEHPYQKQNQGEIIDVDITNNNNNNNDNPNARFCSLCYCYVCDRPVPDCPQWAAHCHATDKSKHWKEQRRRAALAAKRGTVVARFSNARAFRTVVQVAREMKPRSLDFTCSKTSGIRMQAMSVDCISLMELFLPESALAECSGSGGGGDGETVTFQVAGWKVKSIFPWFKGARKSDRFVFRTAVDEEGDGSPALELLREHETKDVPPPLKIKLQEDEPFEPLTIPDTAYDCVVSMDSGRFRDMLDLFLRIVSLGGKIKVTWQRQESKDMVTFCAERNFVDSGQIRRARFHYWTNPQTNTLVSCNTIFGELCFNLRYLLSVLKATTMSSVVEVSFHELYPSRIRYTVPKWSGDGDDGALSYFVAPVLLDDESDIFSEGSMSC